MKRYVSFSLVGLGLLAALSAACASTPALAGSTRATQATVPTAAPQSSRVTDYASLVSALQAAGATVLPGGAIQQPFFSPTGQVAKVNGTDVQVFEFADAASAKSAAQTVAKDGGSVGTSMVNWVELPHFHQTGKIIVLYVGSDAGILAMLKTTVGPQFAGR